MSMLRLPSRSKSTYQDENQQNYCHPFHHCLSPFRRSRSFWGNPDPVISCNQEFQVHILEIYFLLFLELPCRLL